MSEKLKKSKLPDLNEWSSMVTKLFKDVKLSVAEIIDEYKDKRAKDVPQQDKQGDAQAKSKENEAPEDTTAQRKDSDHQSHSGDKEE